MEQSNGLILKLLDTGMRYLELASLGRWVGRGETNRLDVYILAWVVIQAAVLVLLVFFQPGTALKIAIISIFAYRLLEIFVSSFNAVILDVIKKKHHHSIPHLLTLEMVNYLEVILVFGVIYHLIAEDISITLSLNYSISLATLSGLTFKEQNKALLWAGNMEMLLGVFFAAGVIAIMANYLGNREK